MTQSFNEADPAARMRAAIGDLSGVELFNNQVLCVVYTRPDKVGGLYMPDSIIKEDEIQGKAGLILKKGAGAFVDDDGKWFSGASLDVGDWVIFRSSDGWRLKINGVLCRIFDDVSIKGKVDHPERIY